MKLVPKRRFKGFSGEWEERKLSEIAEINPQAMLPESFNYVDLESVVGTELIAYRTENKKSAPSRAQRLAVRGDVFYQMVRPYQKNNYLFDSSSNNFVFSTGYAQMRPNVDSHFLFSRIQEDGFVNSVLSRCTGTSYPAISSNDLENIEINVPTDGSEQVKIGLFFKNLDANIILQEKHLKKLQTMKQAYLHEMFPAEGENVPKRRFEGFTGEWKEQKLGELGWFGRTYTFSRASEGQGDCYHIHYGDIHAKFKGLITKSTRIPSIKTTGSYEFLLDGDIVIADASEDYIDLGKTVVIDDVNNRKIVAGLHTFKFTPNEKLDSVFYLYFSQTDLFKNFTARAGTGISVFGLSKESLFNMKFYLPSTEEQQKIGSFFRKLDERIALQQAKVNKLKAMKQAYLHEMFV